MYGPHWLCYRSRQHLFPVSTLLRLQVSLQRHCPKQALGFAHFPGPSISGDQVLGECTVPCDLCILTTSPVPDTWFPGCAARAVCLLLGDDLWLRPSWQMSTVQDPRKTWLATGSLLTVWKRLPFLGLSLLLAFWLWLLPTCLPASGREWAGPLPASSPLVFAQSFVL